MKFALLGVVLLFLIAGGLVGAATLGFVSIPGISPHKFGKAVVASSNPSSGFYSLFASPMKMLDDKAAQEAASVKPEPVVAKDPGPKSDPSLGDAKLAALWNALDSSKLVSITEKWQPNNLARILLKMDEDQVSGYLAALPAAKAAQISKAIQQFASLPPAPSQG
jgi:hypothetical protein